MEMNTLPEKTLDPASVRDVEVRLEETPQRLKQCYQCGHDNTDQPFCGACGSPLSLNDYISKKAAIPGDLSHIENKRFRAFLCSCFAVDDSTSYDSGLHR
jgi:hypothetical protein